MRDQVIGRLAAHFDGGGYFADLARRVAIRTESQKPEMRGELDRYLEAEMRPFLEALDYEVTVHPNPVKPFGPFLVARRIEDADALTVLTYGHADVIRGLEPEWTKGAGPWEMKIDGERVYGRGVADNKGQHSINLAALKAVIETRGRLGFNSIVLLETGEETGSPGLHQFCAENAELLKADVLFSSDGPRIAPDRPTLFMGSRGAMNLDFDVTLRDGGHHSGNWGGLLSNPGVILAHALASIVDARGRVLVRDLVPERIPNSVRMALGDIAVDGGADAPEQDPGWGEPGLTAAEKVFAWNTFEILAFRTGNPANPVNAIPPRATAHCQIRYTVDRDPKTFVPALRRHLDAAGFPMVAVEEARGLASWGATRMDPDHPWVRSAAASLERSTDKTPALLPNLGGSLPNDCFADTLGLPTIWVPHSYAGCSQHAPDEHGLVPVLREGLLMTGGLFWDLASPERRSTRGDAMTEITVALVQMTSSNDPQENVAFVEARVREAAAAGADLIATPEVTVMIESRRDRLMEKIARQDDDPWLARLRAVAAEVGRHLLVGSMAVKGDGADGRAANRSVLIGPDGGVIATYDKIHMFDVEVGDGERYRESATYAPGDRAVATDIAVAGGPVRLGLTVCYDMRFPALYRTLAQAGAQVIAVPSAFTRPTGAAHWETLLRARAIETGCFVIAPAQTGVHAIDGETRGRKTWGHSLIVAPWGEIVADAGEGVGVIMATLDLTQVEAARTRVPSLSHDRGYAAPAALRAAE